MNQDKKTITLYGSAYMCGVTCGPFGILNFFESSDGLGTVLTLPIEGLGNLGHQSELKVTIEVVKRGKEKKNPWHDGQHARPKPPKYPDYCDSRGRIKA